MRNRRNANRTLYARAASAVGALAFRVWAQATRRPVDAFAVLAAIATSLIIIINAVFLQTGSRPAPFVVNPKPSQAAEIGQPKVAPPLISSHPIAPTVPSQPVAMRRNDPIADLIGPSPRIAAVQSVLSEFGYGQIKPSGVLDEPTSDAIARFEREHKLPVTGHVSERLVGLLAGMAGHPLE